MTPAGPAALRKRCRFFEVVFKASGGRAWGSRVKDAGCFGIFARGALGSLGVSARVID